MSTPAKPRRRLAPPDPLQIPLPAMRGATHDVQEGQAVGDEGRPLPTGQTAPAQSIAVSAARRPPAFPPLTLVEAFDNDREQYALMRSFGRAALDGCVRPMLIRGKPAAIDRVLALLTNVPGFPTEALPAAVQSLSELRVRVREAEAVFNCWGWASKHTDLDVEARQFEAWVRVPRSPAKSIPFSSRPEVWLVDLSRFVSERLEHVPIEYGVPAPRTPIGEIWEEYCRWAGGAPPVPGGVFIALLEHAIPPSDREVSTVCREMQEFVARHWVVR